jgi:hypothetical protein
VVQKMMDLFAATPMDFEIEPVQVHLERLAQIKRALLAERPQERTSTSALPKEIPSGTPPVNPVKPRGTPRPRPSTPVAEEDLQSSSKSRSDAQQVVRNWYKTAQTFQAARASEADK